MALQAAVCSNAPDLLVDDWSNDTEHLIGLEWEPADGEQADDEHQHLDGLRKKETINEMERFVKTLHRFNVSIILLILSNSLHWCMHGTWKQI